MKRKTKQIYSTVIFLVLGVLLIVVILVTQNQPLDSAPISTVGTVNLSGLQESYPAPKSAIVQQPVNQQGVYPPPSTISVEPTSTAIAAKGVFSPTLGKGTITVQDVQRTTQQDAKVAFDGRKALFLDGRSSQSFTSSHVPGAISIPEAQIMERMKELDPNQWIITYCS